MIDRFRARNMHHKFFAQRSATPLHRISQEPKPLEDSTTQENRVKVEELLRRLDEWEADVYEQATRQRAVLNAMLADIQGGKTP